MERQWRIQDFPEGGGQLQRCHEKLYFGNFFSENCMKIKQIAPGTPIPDASFDPPMKAV